MPTVNEVNEYLFSIAPIEMKMEFDNVGLLVGCGETNVSKILVSLDITDDVISEAQSICANLIVSHHPLFLSLKNVTDADNTGKKVINLLSNGISAICMHTNLDAAPGGINDVLAAVIGISGNGRELELINVDGHLATGEAFSLGRVGYLNAPCSLEEFLFSIKKSLKVDGLRYYDAGREVYKVGISSGSGADKFQYALKQGCDTFVSVHPNNPYYASENGKLKWKK